MPSAHRASDDRPTLMSASPLSRRPWLRTAGLLAIVLLVGYVGLTAYLFLNQVELIFRPRRTLSLVSPTLGLQPVVRTIAGLHGPTLAWEMPAGDATLHPNWIVFLHGNDATRSSGGNVVRYHQLRSLGLNVLAPEYPGYADAQGEPSERSMVEAARAAYNYLRRDRGVDGRRIAIYGWSLGSGAAVPVARDADEAALLLEGAFSSVLRRAQAEYPYLPIRFFVRHTFLSEDVIEWTGSPTLFLHSPEDVVIPFSDGERLYQRARAPKQIVRLRGGHITPNLDDEDTYLAAIVDFLSERAGWTLARPRPGVGMAVRAVLEQEGVDAALDAYRRWQAQGDARWNLAEYELEHVGRRLAREERYAEAVAVLTVNSRTFERSPLAWFHLGAAQAGADDPDAARQSFERSLRLDDSSANPSHAALAALR